MPDHTDPNPPPKRHAARIWPGVAAAMLEATGQPFDDWMAQAVLSLSWRKIATQVTALSGVDVSHTLLVHWYPEHDGASIAARRLALVAGSQP